MDNDTFLNVEEGCLFLLALYPLPFTPHPSPQIRTANDDWALEAFLFLMYNIIFKVKTIRNRDEICLRQTERQLSKRSFKSQQEA